jgi:hypothetical protein
MQVGEKIQLKGRSKHGKNRIQQFGTEFTVGEIRSRIHTIRHRHMSGPFALVFNRKTDSIRWIAIENDPDFEIIKKSA